MNLFRKIKLYGQAYLANKAEVPLSELIETQSKMIASQAPAGQPSFYITAQPDGSAIISEIIQPDEDPSDELALRKEMGDIYANALQKQATDTLQSISLLTLEIRDSQEFRQNMRQRQIELLEETPDYFFTKQEGNRNLLWLIILALSEIGIMFNLFLDFFGIDTLKLSREISRNPVMVINTLTFTIGFFVTSLWIAEHAVRGNRRIISLVSLAALSFLTAHFRAVQTAALGENALSSLLLTFMYTMIGFAFPLAAAFFYAEWRDAAKSVGQADSMLRRLRDQEGLLADMLKHTDEERTERNEDFERIKREYVEHYQQVSAIKEKTKLEWERYRRDVEAYLAELRFAYDFWVGWNRRRNSKSIKRLIQIAGMLFFALAISLVFIRSSQAETKLNFTLICDRSSSASDYSCSSETVEAAGRLWIRQADDAGGGTFQLLVIGTGFDSANLIFSVTYPDRFPGPVLANKKQWRNNFIKELLKINLPHNKGSAIVEAISRSSLRVPNNWVTIFYVLSDMREVNQTFNFEERVPAENKFLAWVNNQALNPEFNSSSRIEVCGIHPYSSDDRRMTSLHYERLINLWQSVFEEWGVKANLSEVCNFNDE